MTTILLNMLFTLGMVILVNIWVAAWFVVCQLSRRG